MGSCCSLKFFRVSLILYVITIQPGAPDSLHFSPGTLSRLISAVGEWYSCLRYAILLLNMHVRARCYLQCSCWFIMHFDYNSSQLSTVPANNVFVYINLLLVTYLEREPIFCIFMMYRTSSFTFARILLTLASSVCCGFYFREIVIMWLATISKEKIASVMH